MRKFPALVLSAAMCLILLTACGPQPPADPDLDLAEFVSTVTGTYEFGYLTPMDPADSSQTEYLEQMYPGLMELDLKQVQIHVCMISLNSGELAVVQAQSPEDAAKVAEIFQARIDYMVGDGNGPGGAWYPGPTQLWDECSRIVTHGSYVLMVVQEQCDEITAQFDALF